MLVKGSRSIGLEAVADALAGGVPVGALDGARSHRGILAMVISIVAGPKFIEFLRRNEFGQHIREEGPERPHGQAGDADDGRSVDHARDAVAFLALSRYTTDALTVFFVTVGCAGVGFVDDFIKLATGARSGCRGRWKLVLLAGITLASGSLRDHELSTTSVYIPGSTGDSTCAGPGTCSSS